MEFWIKLACTALDRIRYSGGRLADGGHKYDYPEDMIDSAEQNNFENTQCSNGEYFQCTRRDEVCEFRYPRDAQCMGDFQRLLFRWLLDVDTRDGDLSHEFIQKND